MLEVLRKDDFCRFGVFLRSFDDVVGTPSKIESPFLPDRGSPNLVTSFHRFVVFLRRDERLGAIVPADAWLRARPGPVKARR